MFLIRDTTQRKTKRKYGAAQVENSTQQAGEFE
jgi:hypothetical protein